MKRKIIAINPEKCNGCGQCIPNCHEGALQLIDGKARLISEMFCDGLGACIKECPRGAITIIERDSEPYDESRVMAHIVPQGEHTVAAHLRHLEEHGEKQLLTEAIEYLQNRRLPVPALTGKAGQPHRCPGALAQKLCGASAVTPPSSDASALRQWPVQLRLLNPDAAYFDDADLLISADCVSCACGAFHHELLKGRILIVFCPKLDSDIDGYIEKLAAIMRRHRIKSITVARMTVPCCGGTVAIVEKAQALVGTAIPIAIKTITIDGIIQH